MNDYESDQWQKVWIDPESLGIDPSVDAIAYRKAYQAAYRKAYQAAYGKARYQKFKPPPATFQTEAQRAEARKVYASRAAEKRAAARASAAPPTQPSAAELATKGVQTQERLKAKKKRHNQLYPYRGHEKRIKKVPWALWSDMDLIHAEAKRKTVDTGEQWDCEHIYPVKSDWVCGLHTPENLRVATRQENARKGNRPLGTLGDELWDIDHYSVYWPGDTLTLAQKRLEQAKPIIEALNKAMQRIKAQSKARQQAEKAATPKRVAKKCGRKPMSREKALDMPSVQALLAGGSVREVMRQFSVNGQAVVRYARLVNPDYVSPFHRHGRPQKSKGGV